MAKKKAVETIAEVKEPVVIEPPVVAPVKEESPPDVKLGVVAINDHEIRLWAIEKKLGLR